MTGRAGASPLALAVLAVGSGAAFLWSAGALPGMVTRNIAAFVIALPLGLVAHHLSFRRHGAVTLFTVASFVLASVPVAGLEVDGVRRWLALGSVAVQPALILAPLLLSIVASHEGRHWRFAILLPILLVALQPDAATMLGLAVGTAALMAGASGLSRRGWTSRRTAIACAAAAFPVIGLLIAGVQTPPPVAFVEGTATIAMVSGPFASMLHFLAIALTIAALLSRTGTAGLALAGYFATVVLAAAFWAFPMPVAGAAPSHLLGFGIAIGWLVAHRRQPKKLALPVDE